MSDDSIDFDEVSHDLEYLFYKLRGKFSDEKLLDLFKTIDNLTEQTEAIDTPVNIKVLIDENLDKLL